MLRLEHKHLHVILSRMQLHHKMLTIRLVISEFFIYLEFCITKESFLTVLPRG